MEPMAAPAPATPSARTSPKDFFLWAGVIIALYGSVTALIALLFEYINYAFPDALSGFVDPYGGPVRIAMAAVIVLTPTLVILLRIIRGSIEKEPGKANIWVRRWALGLTLFIATVTILIDLITLINTFLGGEITERFTLKVLMVLLIAAGVFMHFLADMWGYWITYPRRANSVGIGVLVLALFVVVSGFFIIGTPQHVRLLRLDNQKVMDLQNIQSQVISYWQQNSVLPASLDALRTSIYGSLVPVDPQSSSSYEYTVINQRVFQLCASFNAATPAGATDGYLPYPAAIDAGNQNWQHGAGTICFDRTVASSSPFMPKPL